MKSGTNRRDRILAYLDERGGTVVSDDGRGLTAAIAAAVGYDDLPTLNGMLARLERDGVIEREVRGKRTYRISLAKAGARPARASRTTTTRAPQLADPSPSVSELKQSLAQLEARVAGLESELRSTSKRRRRWRAS